jgi:Acyl-CoA reductase (LuxC)
VKLEKRISAFSSLGEILRDALAGNRTEYTSRLNHLIETRQFSNPWFTPENVRMAVSAIANELTQVNLEKWCSAYPDLNKESAPSKVGVIMAGNIPLVGFHDFMCVLLTGNNIIAKTSSKDKDLIVIIKDILCSINKEFIEKITITEGTISGFDAVIATGSDNTSRYFEYYFGKYPHIIRKNRNSIAVIDGSETDNELEKLGTDIFSYFGLGCRNVSKIYLPVGYDLTNIIRCWSSFSKLINNSKYVNNYDYHKAVFMINKETFTDTGYLLLKEHNGLSSPVAVLYYEFYKTVEELKLYTRQIKDKIQCIAGHNYVPFGKSQMPVLWDYADRIDTIEFLLKKNMPGIL